MEKVREEEKIKEKVRMHLPTWKKPLNQEFTSNLQTGQVHFIEHLQLKLSCQSADTKENEN
jgi:hypothetical protein